MIKGKHLNMFQPFWGAVTGWFLARPRTIKQLISIAVDFVIAIFTLWLAFSLRYSELYCPASSQWWIFVLAPLIAVPIFIRFGLYRAIIRYIGIEALWTIVRAVILFMVIFATVVLLAGSLAGVVPRTVYGIQTLLLLIFIGGSRLIVRWLFYQSNQDTAIDLKARLYIPPVLIYGAGNTGVQLATTLKMSHQLRPVAFIDDARNLRGQQINGLRVHSVDDLAKLIDKHQLRDVLLAMPSASRKRRNEIISLLVPYPVHVRTLPDLMDIAEGRIKVSDIHEVDIADLLGREPVAADQSLLHKNIKNKVVMVTGAGGSIGAELCRQIVMLEPHRLILYELSEFNLYRSEKELEKLASKVPLVAVLGSVANQDRIKLVCKKLAVQTIYHAAAYKHVPIVEKNNSEGVYNNVVGTLHCALAAVEAGVETFVLISTDKAVRPTNTMGASKRMAELVLQGLALSAANHGSTRFTMVRFGNVLNSSGSVVPLFREQIANGGPVTVTDPEIIRYFMTITEAAELVIQAGAMGQGGDVFVLDMGEPVRIVDLARRMIHLSGFSEADDEHPDGDIEIKFSGLRPGEKLYEELLIGDNVSPTQHIKIMRAEEKVIPWVELEPILLEIKVACQQQQSKAIRKILMQCVDGFEPQCADGDWSLQEHW